MYLIHFYSLTYCIICIVLYELLENVMLHTYAMPKFDHV